MSNKELGIISFASQLQMEIAVKCRIMVMDATFSVAPIGFGQLFTVHGLYSRDKTDEGEWCVLAWCLMERRFLEFITLIWKFLRATDQYKAFLNALKESWRKIEADFRPERIHCDYEKAEMSAIKEIFGENVLHGCLFHYVKALLLHIRTKFPNMFNIYLNQKSEKGPFWKWVNLIDVGKIKYNFRSEKFWPCHF